MNKKLQADMKSHESKRAYTDLDATMMKIEGIEAERGGKREKNSTWKWFFKIIFTRTTR